MAGSDDFDENEWGCDELTVMIGRGNVKLLWFYGMNEEILVGCYVFFFVKKWVVILL